MYRCVSIEYVHAHKYIDLNFYPSSFHPVTNIQLLSLKETTGCTGKSNASPSEKQFPGAEEESPQGQPPRMLVSDSLTAATPPTLTSSWAAISTWKGEDRAMTSVKFIPSLGM